MDRTNEYRPNYTVHPGRHIAELIETFNISEAEFAGKIGISKKQLKDIIKGKAGITEEIANAMVNVYDGYSPKLWLAFQTGYDEDVKELANRRKEKKPKVEKYILPDEMPIKK